MKNIFLFICTIIFLSSCDEDAFTTVVETDPPKYNPKLFVNNIFSNETDTLYAFVSHNRPLFGISNNNTPNVDDAVMTISDGSKEVVYEHRINNNDYYAPYNYGGILNFPLVEGKSYDLNVEYKDFPIATSTVTFPKAPKAKDVSLDLSDGVEDIDGYWTYKINLTVQDDPNEENYYRVELWHGRVQEYLISEINPILEEGLDWRSIIISDETFNGEDKEIVLDFETYNAFEQENELKVKVIAISKNQYEYEKRQLINDDAGDNPFVSQIPTLTNIKDGLGIFAIENRQTYDVLVK